MAARSLYARTHPEVPHESLVVYTTTQTHSLGLKAGKILGLNVRAIEVETADGYALRGATLRAALEHDLKKGKHPFILSKSYISKAFPLVLKLASVVATIGSTSSGAVDNMQEIKEVGKSM